MEASLVRWCGLATVSRSVPQPEYPLRDERLQPAFGTCAH
jgi:hypothetical protein